MSFWKIHWDAVIEGTAAGVIASTLIAAWIILRDAMRNFFLEQELRRQLRTAGCGVRVEGIMAEIKNLIGKEFVVRQVVLVTDQAEYSFTATGEVSSCLKPTKTKFTKEQRERLKKGLCVPVGPPRFYLPSWRVEPTVAGFVTIKPFTCHCFLLPAGLIAVLKGKNEMPICLRIMAEYQSWNQRTMIIQQRTVGFAAKTVKDRIADFQPLL